MLSDERIAKDLCCSSKQENDPTVFSIRVSGLLIKIMYFHFLVLTVTKKILKAYCKETRKASNCQRQFPNCMIQLFPPITVYNLLPYAMEIKLLHIKYEVRIEAGDKTNVYFLNLQKPQKITIEVNPIITLMSITEIIFAFASRTIISSIDISDSRVPGYSLDGIVQPDDGHRRKSIGDGDGTRHGWRQQATLVKCINHEKSKRFGSGLRVVLDDQQNGSSVANQGRVYSEKGYMGKSSI